MKNVKIALLTLALVSLNSFAMLKEMYTDIKPLYRYSDGVLTTVTAKLGKRDVLLTYQPETGVYEGVITPHGKEWETGELHGLKRRAGREYLNQDQAHQLFQELTTTRQEKD